MIASNRPHLLEVAAAFDQAVDKCAADAGIETVHRLRTGSRRVQATVEMILREAGAGAQAFEKPANAWLRPIKNIRRAAGPVRDLDMHRKLLAKWVKKPAEEAAEPTPARVEAPAAGSNSGGSEGSGSIGGSSPEADRLRSQAEKLDQWLKEKRDARAEALQKKIKKLQEKVKERQVAFLAAVDRAHRRSLKRRRLASAVALEDFVRVVDRMPSLDSGNLHDFRKATKKGQIRGGIGRRRAVFSGAGQSAQTCPGRDRRLA